MTVGAPGFRALLETGVQLESAQVRRVTLRLQIGPITEEITVVARPGRFNTDTALKSELITSRLTSELPLNGRNYMDLAVLAPGVYHRVGADEQGDGLSASGARADSAGFALDGLVNRADRNATPGIGIPVDAVREFDVQTSSLCPRRPGAQAARQVSVVTTSLAPTASRIPLSDYMRETVALDARNYLRRPGEQPALQRNQAAGTLGGPLRRDRIFFFGAYERLHEQRAQSANTTAPNEAWLRGDFRNVRGAGADGAWGNADDTNRIVDPFTRKEFATPNVIPADRVRRDRSADARLLPAANLATARRVCRLGAVERRQAHGARAG